MLSIFKPSIALMNRLAYRKKLILIGVITLMVLFGLAFQLINASLEKMAFSKKEIEGVIYINPIVSLMSKLQNYRQSETLNQLGKDQDKNKLSTARDEITASFNTISEKNNADQRLKTGSAWHSIQMQWEKIANSNTPDKFEALSKLISKLQNLIVMACDNSNLTLDPDIDTYYLMDSFCTKLPNITDEASIIQTLGMKAVHEKTLQNTDREQLLILKTLLENSNLVDIAGNIEKTVGYNPFQFPVFDPLKQTLVSQGKQAINSLNMLLNNELTDTAKFNELYSTFLTSTYQLYEKTEMALKELLIARIKNIKKNLYLNLALSTLGGLLIAYLFAGIYISTLRGLHALAQGSDKLAKGDLSAKVELDSKDELKEVAQSFNRMRDVLHELIRDTHSIVNNVMQGDLNQRINTNNKEGFAKELTMATNQMTDIFQDIINEIINLLSAIAKGDLTITVNKQYLGVFDELKTYANSTLGNVQRLMKDIKFVAETIKQAAQNIVRGNNDFSKRTAQQAAFLEETSITTEELTTTVKQNAENAKQANELAQSASNVAVKGGDVVNQVINTMSSINESSHKVADIISVIDGIAFQTNILALNAAVEAARAGEQGRGFAVVATEVRNLAQRSSAAAKEIKTLINESVENVTSGKKLVDSAGGTMTDIVKAVNQVAEIMLQITTASTEQSLGIEQVNQAVSQMDKVIAQNATLVEQAAGAAESLETQIKHMEELVSLFKLGELADEKKSKSPKISLLEEQKKPTSNLSNEKLMRKDEWEEF